MTKKRFSPSICNRFQQLLQLDQQRQDGIDKLVLEVHNPTSSAKIVKLTAVSGFPPLTGLNKTVKITPCSSAKLELPTPAGTLVNSA